MKKKSKILNELKEARVHFMHALFPSWERYEKQVGKYRENWVQYSKYRKHLKHNMKISISHFKKALRGTK